MPFDKELCTKSLFLAEHAICAFSLRSTKCLALACEAGVSIKPGVKRGFASETPGTRSNGIRAHEMGGSACAANLVGIFAAFVLSPAFAGLKTCRAQIPGVSLAKLASPQALCLRLLRRLKADISCVAG